ncbi:MAG: TetR/AcrR family transcriptional regulator [Deltaproteobacteria bacterium]|nr:TetR/AcrR family transcriptional regulator [Deltaproteobacteria bacterium]
MEILNAASNLFSKKGYVETTIDEIANLAGVTKGGVYYYFDSKADILYRICLSYVEADIKALEEKVGRIQDSEKKLKYIVDLHIGHYAKQKNYAKTLLHESYNLPRKYLADIKAKERRYYEMVLEIVSDLVGEGTKKEVAVALTFSLFAMMNWIYKWYDPKGPLKPEELSAIVFNLFMNGLKGIRKSSALGGGDA